LSGVSWKATEGDSLADGLPPAGRIRLTRTGVRIATSERELRVARNLLLFRAVNARIQTLGERMIDVLSEAEFACECGRPDCDQTITITLEEFRAIGAKTNRFIVLRGHEDLDAEDIVGLRLGYVIVATRGAEREVVKQNT
jgi:hypothetical protein